MHAHCALSAAVRSKSPAPCLEAAVGAVQRDSTCWLFTAMDRPCLQRELASRQADESGAGCGTARTIRQQGRRRGSKPCPPAVSCPLADLRKPALRVTRNGMKRTRQELARLSWPRDALFIIVGDTPTASKCADDDRPHSPDDLGAPVGGGGRDDGVSLHRRST